MYVCMYVFYLDLLRVNTFIIEKCDVLKENGEKRYKSITTQTRTIRRGVRNLSHKFHLYLIVIHLNTLLNLFI